VVTHKLPLRIRHSLVRRGFTLPKAKPERLLFVESRPSALGQADGDRRDYETD